MGHVVARAVVMGKGPEAESHYEFAVDPDFFDRPADEAIERFMAHLHEVGFVKHHYAYELNSAIRNTERKVIMAIGQIRLGREDLPFTVMLHPKPM